MVSGNFVKNFMDASHVLLEGNLNDPSFRKIAIQKIKMLRGERIQTDNGEYDIITSDGEECIVFKYRNIFGDQVTTKGNPFKDDKTDAIGSVK